MSPDILGFHEKLNAAGVVPSYRRNDIRYPLVSCVNSIVACLLSKNYDVAALFVNRAAVELTRLRQAASQTAPDETSYFELVERYLRTVQPFISACGVAPEYEVMLNEAWRQAGWSS